MWNPMEKTSPSVTSWNVVVVFVFYVMPVRQQRSTYSLVWHGCWCWWLRSGLLGGQTESQWQGGCLQLRGRRMKMIQWFMWMKIVCVFLFCEMIDWRSVSVEGFGKYQTPKKASAALVHDLENWPSLTSKGSDSSCGQGWWVGILRLVHFSSRHIFKWFHMIFQLDGYCQYRFQH